MPERITCPTCLGIKTVACAQCGGTGWDEEGGNVCSLCWGEKTVICPDCLGKGEYWTGSDVCLICQGKGGEGCAYCRGTGVLHTDDGGFVPCDACKGTGISICEYCSGKGYYDQADREKCMRCGGTGKGLCLACAHIEDENYVCPVCGGTRIDTCVSCGGTGKGYSLVNTVEEIYGVRKPGEELNDYEKKEFHQKICDALTSFGLEKIDPDEVNAAFELCGPEYPGSAVIDVLEKNGRSFFLDWKMDPAHYVPWINKCLQNVSIDPVKHELHFSENHLKGEAILTWRKKDLKLPFEFTFNRYEICLGITEFMEAINELINDSGYEFVPYDTWSDDYGFIFIQSIKVKDFTSKEIMDGFFQCIDDDLEDE
jgi:hypothetical protein